MLFTNTLAQSSRLITGYALSFLIAPLMLSRLGLEAFGIWAVTGAIATYAALLDLGLGRSLSRFVALFDARGEPDRIRECLGLGLLAVAVVGGLSAGLAIGLAPLVSDLLDYGDESGMRTILLCSVAILAAQSAVQVMDAVPIGLRRMIPPNATGTLTNFLVFGVGVAVLLSTRALEDYARAVAGAYAGGVVASAASLVFVWGRRLPAWPRRQTSREILSFGVRNQIGWVADLVNFQTDKIIIAGAIGPRAAGAYEIAARVVGALRSVSILTVSAMIPTLTAEIASRGREVIAGHYRRYTRRSVSIAFPIFALGCVTAPFLLEAWLEDVPADSLGILVAISLAYAVNLVTGVASTTAIAEGRPGMVAVWSSVGAALNVGLTLGLAPFFGLWGILAGTFVALAASSLLFVRRFHRVYDVPGEAFAWAVLPPAALAAGLAGPFVLPAVLLDLSGRPPAAAALVLVGLGYTVAYWVLASRLDFLPDRLSLRRVRPVPAPGPEPVS